MRPSRSGENQFSYLDFCVEARDERLDLALSEFEGYVTGVIQESMASKVLEIVAKLNSIGHKLESDEFDVSGFDFVDSTRQRPDKRLRLAFSFSVSVDFEEPCDTNKDPE